MSLMYIMQNWWLELQGLSAVFDLGISTHNNVSMEELYVWNRTHEVFF